MRTEVKKRESVRPDAKEPTPIPIWSQGKHMIPTISRVNPSAVRTRTSDCTVRGVETTGVDYASVMFRYGPFSYVVVSAVVTVRGVV